jgi:tetratricopeptide (TPR) repeat protein
MAASRSASTVHTTQSPTSAPRSPTRRNERSYELLLAQALGEDGRLEEAINYFLNLWEAQPGDGFINLQLARLERQQNDLQKNDRQRNGSQAAVNYYRASIFGSWNGDGVIHRRDVRVELANYLIDQKQFSLAQTELLVAASNAPSDPGISVTFGDTLLRANDPTDALKQYQKAILEDPHNAIAYEKAGRLAYNMGDYTRARDWLEKALRESAGALGSSAEPEGDTSTLLKNTERLLVLDPGSATTRSERVTRILDDRAIAEKRFDACVKQTVASQISLETLTSRWTSSVQDATRAALMRDDANQDLVRSLVDDTETITAKLCRAPQGDDALLLLLAQHNTNR